MPDQAFTKTQVKQLGQIIDQKLQKNNRMIAVELSRVVETLDEVVKESEERVTGKMKAGFENVDKDFKSLALTMASKYEVKDLDRRVKTLELSL